LCCQTRHEGSEYQDKESKELPDLIHVSISSGSGVLR
jgi:hypothetical protein